MSFIDVKYASHGVQRTADGRWLANSLGSWSLAAILCCGLDRQRLFSLLLDSIDDVLKV